MAVKFANLASSTLASSLSNTATSISVTSSSSFPTLGSGDYFYASIGEGSGSEIVKVTGVSSNTFTVVRGQDGTSAQNWSSGSPIALRVVAAALDDIASAADTESVSIAGDTMTGTLTAPTINVNGKLSVEHDGSTTGDLLSLFSNRFDGTTMYGWGVASGTLYHKAATRHQFYTATNYDNSSYDVQFDGQNFIIRTGDLMMGSNTFVDSSRNITAGTISSGAITSTGSSNFVNINVSGGIVLGSYANNGYQVSLNSNTVAFKRDGNYSYIDQIGTGHLAFRFGSSSATRFDIQNDGRTKITQNNVTGAVRDQYAGLVVEGDESHLQISAFNGGDWASSLVLSNTSSTVNAHYWLHHAPTTASTHAGRLEFRYASTTSTSAIGGQGGAALLSLDSSANAYFQGTIKAPLIEIDDRLTIDGAKFYDNATNGNNKGFAIGGGGLVPVNGSGTSTNNHVDIGTSSYRFRNLYLRGDIEGADAYLRYAQVNDGNANYGDYGRLFFYATSNYTSSARRWLLTNSYKANRFAFLYGNSSTQNPGLTTYGNEDSNTGVAFDIDNVGQTTFHKPLTISHGNDQLLTLNQATTGWNYIGFEAAGTRKFFLGNDATTGFVLGSDVANQTFAIQGFDTFDINSANITDAGTITSGEINTTAPEFRWVYSTDNNVGLLVRGETYTADEADITATRLQTGNTTTLGLAGQNGINFYTAGTKVLDIDTSGDSTFTGHIITNTSSRIENGRISMEADGTLDWGASKNSGTLTWDTGKIIVRGQSGNAIEFQTNGTTVAATFDTSGNADFTGHISGASGSVSGKFAVKSSSVHASYDLYNNGTTYLNGSTTVDDALTVSGSSAQLVISGQNNSVNTANPAFRRGSAGEAFIDAPGHVVVNIDSNSNNTDRYFGVSRDAQYNSPFFTVSEAGKVHLSGDDTYIQVGGTGGKAAVMGNTYSNDGSSLDYRAYWAYDSYWDGSNWQGIRTNLGRKWMFEMGYHGDSFQLKRFDGTISGGWADSDWGVLFSVNNAGTGTLASDLYVKNGQIFLGTANSSSGHINAYELMTFNIDTDNDDTNRYFKWTTNANSGGGSQLMYLDESGNLTVTGNFTVQGTTTTLNTATLQVEDKNIVLNYGSGDTSGSADGAGITIQDAVNSSSDASIAWNASDDYFNFSHHVHSPGLTVDYTGHRTGDAGILVTNDASDWGIKIDKDGTDTYGLLVQADGDHAITVRNSSGAQKIKMDGAGEILAAGALIGNHVKVQNTSPTIIINDTNATNATDQTGYISFQRNGTEKAWIGYGSSSSSDFTIYNTEGNVTVSQGLAVNGNTTIDAGTNTYLNVVADDGGMAEIKLYGDSQGTGRVYVGQSTTYGGGIEYNGDASPSTIGAPADSIALYRMEGGTDYWTAYNYYSQPMWHFRNDIYSGGQIRATGWYGSASEESDRLGLAAEIGVSSGRAHLISYNRTTSQYGNLTISAPDVQISYGTGDVTFKSGSVGIGLTDWDTTNLALDVNGHMNIRRGSHLYLGVNTNSYNSWQIRLYNSGSTAYLNAQSFIFSNAGYGSDTFFQADSSGFNIATGGLEIGGTALSDSSRNVTATSVEISGGTSTTTTSELVFKNYADTGAIKSKYYDPNATTETYMAFHTNNAGESNGTNSESMRLLGPHLAIGRTDAPRALSIRLNGGGSDVGVDIHNSGTADGDDAVIGFETHGQYDWTMGIDRSEQKFVIARSTTLGTNNQLLIDASSNAQLNGSFSVSDSHVINAYHSSTTSGGKFNLPRAGAITFYGDQSLYHGIMSRDASGNSADDLRINSYGSVYINLDSNGNNSSGANFYIGRHGQDVNTISSPFLYLDGESGNLAIGTGTASHKVDIYSDENTPLRVHRPNSALDSTEPVGIGFSLRGDSNTSTSDTRAGIYSQYNGDFYISVDAGGDLDSDPFSEQALFIEGANKNVMIGKTASNTQTAGVELRSGGTAGKVQISRSNNPLSLFNTTDNGATLSLYKGTSNIGQLGVEGGDSLYIQHPGSSGGGLRFHSSGRISPVRSGALASDVIDLGSSTQRFKNLHLSETAYAQELSVASRLIKGFDTSGYFHLGNNDWTDLIVMASGSNESSYDATNKGVSMAGGSKWFKIKTRFPIDPEAQYRIIVRVKQVSTTSGSGSFYCAVDTLNENFSSLSSDTAGSYNYGVAIGSSLSAGTTYTFDGVFSGYNATNTGDHNKFDPEGKYFDILFITNYQGNGTTCIQSIEIERVVANPVVEGLQKSSSNPIVINSKFAASTAMRVYYDMDVYNTIRFTDSSWTSQGQIGGSGNSLTYKGDSHTFQTKSGGAIGYLSQTASYLYSQQSNNSFSVGRNSNENFNIYVNDQSVTLTANQDSDENAAHSYIMNRQFGGSGANDFKIQKAGATQLNIDTDGHLASYSPTGGQVYSISTTSANNNAKLGAVWNSETGNGVFLEYHPNSAVAYLQNNYPMQSGQVYGDIHIRQLSGGSWQTRLLFDNDAAKAVFSETVEINAGDSSTLRVLCADNGNAEIMAQGSSQGTGRLFVGQSSSYGGGIEYNGDASPVTSGAGSDYVTLYRRDAGNNHWTARNSYSSADWEFRNNVKTGAAISLKNNAVYRAAHFAQSGSSTGAILIQLPGTRSGNWSMPVIRVTVYEYSGDAHNVYLISGHNWTSGWYNNAVTHTGNNPELVKLVGNSTTNKDGIIIGGTSTSRSYLHVTVDVLAHPQFYNGNQNFLDSWSVGLITSESGWSGTGNLTKTSVMKDANNTIDVSGAKFNQMSIGTTNTSNKLMVSDGNQGFEVNPNSGSEVRLNAYDRTNSAFRIMRIKSSQFYWENGSTIRFSIDGSGNGIFEGNVTAYGSASDIRLKENVEVIPDALDKVKKLDGVTFNYKKDGSRSTGLIAQQLQEVLEEAVYETSDAEGKEEHLAIRYGNVVGLLVEAIKEQSDQIETLNKRIEELEHGNH